MVPKQMNLTRNERSLWMRPAWLCLLGGMAAIVMLPVVYRCLAQVQAPETTPQTAAGAPPPANPQMTNQFLIPPEAATPVADQEKETVAEAANLLKMATDLKAEVDKTSKDMLSVEVVRKAGEIEVLAHKVRTK